MATPAETIETEPRRSARGLQIALGVVLVVVLLGLAWLLVLRPSGEAVPAAGESVPAPQATPEQAPAVEAPEAAPAPGTGPKETTKLFAPKDPFEPLVSPTAATGATDGATDTSTAADASGDTGGGATTGDDTAGAGGVDEAPIPGDTGGGGNGGGGGGNGGGVPGGGNGGGKVGDDGSGSGGGITVELTSVDGQGPARSAAVLVDGRFFMVQPGERFAGNFKVLTIYGECSDLLFGDDQFTLCEGEAILK